MILHDRISFYGFYLSDFYGALWTPSKAVSLDIVISVGSERFHISVAWEK